MSIESIHIEKKHRFVAESLDCGSMVRTTLVIQDGDKEIRFETEAQPVDLDFPRIQAIQQRNAVTQLYLDWLTDREQQAAQKQEAVA